MPYCVPPIVNSWSKNGELPNTSPERAERPITNRTGDVLARPPNCPSTSPVRLDRKSTRLNSSHGYISYAVFCLKKKKKKQTNTHYLQARKIMHTSSNTN